MWQVVSLIAGMIFSKFGSDKQKKQLEEAQQYQASQSYSSAVRSVALMREQRQLDSSLLAEMEASSEEIEDLQSQMDKALENAELVKGVQGPIVKPMPIEKILLPAAIAFIFKVVIK